jgi:hypothetical protein
VWCADGLCAGVFFGVLLDTLACFLSCMVKSVVLGCRPWLLVRVGCVVVQLVRVPMLGAQPTAVISGKQLACLF